MSGNLRGNEVQSTAIFQTAGNSRPSAANASTPGQIFRAEHQPLHPFTAPQRLHDLGHVGNGDFPVKKMIRFDQNGHTARALVETSAATGARLQTGEPGGGELFFQGLPDFA